MKCIVEYRVECRVECRVEYRIECRVECRAVYRAECRVRYTLTSFREIQSSFAYTATVETVYGLLRQS